MEIILVATTILPNNSTCSSQAKIHAANGTMPDSKEGISPKQHGSNDNFDLTGFKMLKLERFRYVGKKVCSFSTIQRSSSMVNQIMVMNQLGTYYFVIIERDNVETNQMDIYQ
jgi:hypothetical protein